VAGVVIVVCLLATVGYLAAPDQRGGIADISGSVRADFSSALSQIPLTSEPVAAALLVDPSRLHTDRTALPADPTMTGEPVDASRIAALVRKAAWATNTVSYSGVQRVIAPRDAGSTAADVRVDSDPERGSTIQVRNLSGDVVAQGLVPTPAAARLADNSLWTALTSAYRVSAVDGGTLLGRPVTMLQARRPGSAATDAPAARWWIDARTGLVLRQQTYDHAGRLVLAAGFTSLHIGDQATKAVAQALAERPLTAPQTTAAFTTASAGQLSSQGWFCHAELAGMSLIRLRADAPAEPGVLHMIYTDGLSTVSVFERRGVLSGPPSGSQWDPNLGAYRTDAMLNTATWQSGDAVFTVATDGSTALRDTVVAALPHGGTTSRTTMERIQAGWSRVLDHVR
jgi:hypothetical protein